MRDKTGSENLIANHLSRIVDDREFESHISKWFPNKKLFAIWPNP